MSLRVDDECTLSVVRYGIPIELTIQVAEWPKERQRW